VSASDVELGWRAAQAGLVIGFAPDALVVKVRRPGTRATWRQWQGYGRGARWIAARHGHGLARNCVRGQVRTLAGLVRHPGQVGRAEGRRRWVCWTAQAVGYLRGPGSG
jgi:GT2 family glycosyltransferase